MVPAGEKRYISILGPMPQIFAFTLSLEMRFLFLSKLNLGP